MKDSEYLEQLFIEYLSTLSAMNEVSQSFYSKDEYKLRHRMFKQIYSRYRAYKFKLWIDNIKKKMFHVKQNITKRRIKKIVRDYNQLKENGEFLPKIKD